MSEKILITGGSGFIGSHLIETLLKKELPVKVLVRKTSSLRYIPTDRVELCYGDIREPDSLAEAVRDVSAVIHLAGSVIAPSLEHFLRSNRDGTSHLLQSLERYNPTISKFIYISSLAAAGPVRAGRPLIESDTPQPVSSYGLSKLEAEKVVQQFSTRFTTVIIRPAVVYGPRDVGFFNIIKMVKSHIRAQVGFAPTYLSLIHVADLCQLLTLTLSQDIRSGEVFFASNNEQGYRLQQVYYQIVKELKTWSVPLYIPRFLLYLSALIGTTISRIRGKPSFLNMDKYHEMAESDWRCSCQKAKESLGFNPEYDLQRGLSATIQWYRENNWI